MSFKVGLVNYLHLIYLISGQIPSNTLKKNQTWRDSAGCHASYQQAKVELDISHHRGLCSSLTRPGPRSVPHPAKPALLSYTRKVYNSVCLVLKFFLQHLSQQIFRHIHKTLNVVEKIINHTV